MQTQAAALEVVQGAKAAWKLTLRDRLAQPITTYTGAAALAADCWIGEDTAVLFHPAVAWDTPTAGTVRLSVTSAQTAALSTGVYNLLLWITTTGDPVARPIAGGLRIAPGPGLGTTRPVYSTYRDMKTYAGSWLDALQRLDSDETGFAEERADAREKFDELLQRHYRGAGNTLGSALTGYAPWTAQRYGFKSVWLQQQLDANALVVDRAIREYCSCYALSLVCGRQMQSDSAKDYARMASRFMRRAELAALGISAEVTTGATTGVIIHLGIVDRIRA